jgi:hypothetical protein
LADSGGVEAESGRWSCAQRHGAEVARVVVDPPACHACHARDLARTDKPPLSWDKPRHQALDDPIGQQVGEPT